MEKVRHQTSETFRLSALLALSGGFQDAYTYNVRDRVFSNAQTGNVVLMSQHLMMGKWAEALHYLFPVIAFAMGVFVAERVQQKYNTGAVSTGVRLLLPWKLRFFFWWDLFLHSLIWLPLCWYLFPAPCRFRPSEKYTVMVMPVPCASEIYGREQRVCLFI